jgi:uncharacterized membrane-anchored protein YitT (DUF2179 family)
MNSLKRFWPWFRDMGLILIGSLAQAIGLRLFLVPAQLASGGVSGIAQLINYYTDWPIGVMVFIGNIPLFLLGWRFLGGRRFGWRTATAVISYSFFVDFLVLFFVILGAGLVFGWKQALYALIALYASGLVAETTLEGPTTVRTALIVTGQPEIVSARILDDMQRGVTVMPGTGAYTGASRPVLYCVVTKAEIAFLKTIVQEADPQAFMVIGQAHEALGEGFQPLRTH